MGINYGRIRIIYNDATSDGEFGGIYKRNTCGKERQTEGGKNTFRRKCAEK